MSTLTLFFNLFYYKTTRAQTEEKLINLSYLVLLIYSLKLVPAQNLSNVNVDRYSDRLVVVQIYFDRIQK